MPGLLPEASSWPWKSLVCRIVNETEAGGAALTAAGISDPSRVKAAMNVTER